MAEEYELPDEFKPYFSEEPEDLGAKYADRMAADIELSPEDEESIWELLSDVKVKFWCCSRYTEHRQDNDYKARPIVEWDGDLATCLICGETNADG